MPLGHAPARAAVLDRVPASAEAMSVTDADHVLAWSSWRADHVSPPGNGVIGAV